MEPGNAVAEPVARPADTSSHAPSRPLRLLVGYDGRPASRDALAFAKALGEVTATELTVASVRAYWPQLLGESFELVVKEDEHWVRRGATKILGETPFSVRVIAGGHETAGLREIAAAEDSDVIVVGSTHRGRIGQVYPGSVGERVLDEAPCAVAIAPRGLAEQKLRFGTIAVGFDDSREAHVALETAIGLVERTGAALRILGVAETSMGLGLEGGPAGKEEQRHLARQLERVAAEAGRRVKASSQVLDGIPSHALPEAAKHVDLLVLGCRGHYGPARRLLLGSVAARVTRTAPCPTLITP
jgi:nucleotide-binding universal stress UspA family protein